MARHRRYFSRFVIPLAVLAIVLAVSYRLWLPLIGRALVHDDGPAAADIAVVLGGDYWGHRIETAGYLVRRGLVPSVLVSGPPGFYGAHETDLAIPYAIRKGFPVVRGLSERCALHQGGIPRDPRRTAPPRRSPGSHCNQRLSFRSRAPHLPGH